MEKEILPVLFGIEMIFRICSCLLFIVLCFFVPCVEAQTYYVDFAGGSSSGDGSSSSPWDTITNALDSVPDGSTVLVRPGTYNGRIRIRGTFSQGVTVKAEESYKTLLRHTATVLTAYQDSRGCQGITIEGFDIAHSGAGAGALVFHIDGGGSGAVSNITLKNNVFHDSYNNDLLKINNATNNITVSGNMFYNQAGSDEHIDLNSVDTVIVQDNVFFNSFSASGRVNGNDTSSYIVIKDSNEDGDLYQGSRNITVRRNIFLNWEGSTGSNFVLVGEDGKDYFEAFNVLIENNLLIGNSDNVMRAPFGVKGGRNITFRNNTVVGNLPSYAFAMRLNTEGDNPSNQDIYFYNNIWSDPTGTMGARSDGDSNDFSDTPSGETGSFAISYNLYFNGGQQIPSDSVETVNYTDDASRVLGDPALGSQSALLVPYWDASSEQFADGSTTIRQVFERLVSLYGTPGNGSQALDSGSNSNSPNEDILGENRPAGAGADIGAYENQSASTAPGAPRNLRFTN